MSNTELTHVTFPGGVQWRAPRNGQAAFAAVIKLLHDHGMINCTVVSRETVLEIYCEAGRITLCDCGAN